MGIIEEGIVVNSDNTLSFGNYEATSKVKIDDFKVGNDTYKLRTYNEVTRLTKNHTLVFESVPGATVHDFNFSEQKITFTLEGDKDVQVTLELTPHSTYKVTLDSVLVDEAKANAISGKINFSLALLNGVGKVKIEKMA